MYPGEVIMKKVELRMNEQNKYEIIKKLVETDENKKRAATKLGCTVRTINNLSLNTRNRERSPSLEVITIFFRTTFKPFLSICRFYRLFLYF